MATRKRFRPRPGPNLPERVFADFMRALLAGEVQAERVYAARGASFSLDYDEPDAVAPITRPSG